MTPSDLLSLRHRVPDGVLLDWLDLEQLLPARPCHVRTDVLGLHWCCSQSAVSRRLARLWEADLLDYRSGAGRYRIKRLGPSASDTHRLLINETPSAARSLPL